MQSLKSIEQPLRTDGRTYLRTDPNYKKASLFRMPSFSQFIINLNNVYKNGFIITWILHQIIMFFNKVKLVAG